MWVAACLMAFYHHPRRVECLASLFGECFQGPPPVHGHQSWSEALAGDLRLYFEVSLPAPKSYKAWLCDNIDEQRNQLREWIQLYGRAQ